MPILGRPSQSELWEHYASPDSPWTALDLGRRIGVLATWHLDEKHRPIRRDQWAWSPSDIGPSPTIRKVVKSVHESPWTRDGTVRTPSVSSGHVYCLQTTHLGLQRYDCISRKHQENMKSSSKR